LHITHKVTVFNKLEIQLLDKLCYTQYHLKVLVSEFSATMADNDSV